MSLRWDVPYEPGALAAVGSTGGRRSAECSHLTAGEPRALRAEAVERSVRGDGTGIAHVVVKVVDDRGTVAPHAGPELAFEVSGAGTLAGLENGDPLDITRYGSTRRRAFHGLALAVARAKKETGTIRLSVAADGLSPAAVEIEAR